MNDTVIDFNGYLELAERQYLFENITEFQFDIRKRPQIKDFYSQLENSLQNQKIFKVSAYRVVREGYTRISRPSQVSISLQTLLEERPYLSTLKKEITQWPERFPKLNIFEFARRYPAEALADLTVTYACAEVLSYLISHRDMCIGLLPREIPHGQSTKLILREPLLLKMYSFIRGRICQWRDLMSEFGLLSRPAEFRIYAPVCSLQGARLKHFHGLISREFYLEYDFQELSGTLILENFENFLPAARSSKDTLIVWGGGWRAAGLNRMWIKLPRPVYYWGDMDKEGYEIYGHLKRQDPDLRPLLMDFPTIHNHKALQQFKDKFWGPFKEVGDLQAEYEFVCKAGLQIEQEQLQIPWPHGTNLR